MQYRACTPLQIASFFKLPRFSKSKQASIYIYIYAFARTKATRYICLNSIYPRNPLQHRSIAIYIERKRYRERLHRRRHRLLYTHIHTQEGVRYVYMSRFLSSRSTRPIEFDARFSHLYTYIRTVLHTASIELRRVINLAPSIAL